MSDDIWTFVLQDITLSMNKHIVRGEGLITVTIGNGEGSVNIEMTLTSPSWPFFLERADIERVEGGRIMWNGVMNDGNSHAILDFDRGIMTRPPLGQSKGKYGEPNMTFTIEFEQIRVLREGSSSSESSSQ